MASEKAGYKRAAAHFGISVDTCRTWGREERGAGSRPRARARAAELGLPVAPPPVDHVEAALAGPDLTLTWDPTTCTREEFLVRAVPLCLGYANVAMAQKPPHGGVARQWLVTASSLRADLDALRAERAASEAAAGRSAAALEDPAELAKRALRVLPSVVWAAPSVAVEVLLELVEHAAKADPDGARRVHGALGRWLE